MHHFFYLGKQRVKHGKGIKDKTSCLDKKRRGGRLEIISYLVFIYRAGAWSLDGVHMQLNAMGIHATWPDTLGRELVTDEDMSIYSF